MRAPMVDRLITAGLLSLALALACAAAAGLLTPGSQRIVTEAIIKLVVVVGLSIFVGNSGVLSFGHVSFMAIGAYTSAIVTMAPARKDALLDLPAGIEAIELPFVAGLIAAALASGLVALVVGWPLARLRGIAMPMATFAVLAIVHVVALNWKAVTGGRQALVGLPQTTTMTSALIAAVVTLAAAALYQQSRRGLLLRCARENEVAAEATGVAIGRERLVAFVVSAVFVGLGGALFAHFLGTVTANTFYLDMTFVTLAMLVVGGLRSLTGAALGVAVVTAVTEILRTIERGFDIGGAVVAAPSGTQQIALAAILLVILVVRPDGLAGDWELTWPRRGAGTDRAKGDA